ncbi:MAG: dienelactone hydrolase family protein [Chitinophagales bacterium]
MKTSFRFSLFFSLLFYFTFSVNAQLKPVAYNDAFQQLNGLAATPKKTMKKKAGVLILPAWKGIDARAKKSAEDLAKLGYYTFVADIYGEGNYPKTTEEAGKQAGYYKSHIDEYRHRIHLALEQLIKSGADSNNIIVIGYCFGGTGALEAARANFHVKGVVSFHGGLSRDTSKMITIITPKILVCHGADDFYISENEIKTFQNEMRNSKADWQMIYYANSVHSFTDFDAGNDNSKGAAYNEKAAKSSWKAMLDFMDELLQ